MRLAVPSLRQLALLELRQGGDGIIIQVTPAGALFAIRHGATLINQLLPGPAEDGLFRLLLRSLDGQGAVEDWVSVVGAGAGFSLAGRSAAQWSVSRADQLECRARLELHPTKTAWRWVVSVSNRGPASRRFDLLLAQDLGLADEAAVRTNEAYTSHYIDLLPVEDEVLGRVVLARQNQAASGGRHPWLAAACGEGAAGFCTDGWQFFGADHRRTAIPAAIHSRSLPSQRLQYEFALAGLQSAERSIAPGETAEFSFLFVYRADHPEASSQADLAVVRELAVPSAWPSGEGAGPAREKTAGAEAPPAPSGSGARARVSLFRGAPWLHGDAAGEADWAAWFPGERRHEERGADGLPWSFFHGIDTHVVAGAKEAVLARPHGHILRSGAWEWVDDQQFGVTCFAAGVFGAQAYLGNPSTVRLLPVLRNALGLARGSGQRVFVRRGGSWHQLGVPSAFAMSPGAVRWIYRLGGQELELRVWCARGMPASFLEVRVSRGGPLEFLVSHQLALGPAEFENEGLVAVHSRDAWFACEAGDGSLWAQHLPGASFAIAASDAHAVAEIGSDALIGVEQEPGVGSYAVFSTRPVRHFGVILLGTLNGSQALDGAVAQARELFGQTAAPADPPRLAMELAGSDDPGVARFDEVLPWLNHNAAIHFSAPHGLEQYGGGAWGVRDVCQGSVEWLLAQGRHDVIRRVLELVFAQQYARTGTWPQWFMFPPFGFIQQPHSHGDVCFWPIKALCDYVEASNDFGILEQPCGYTDAQTFGPAEPQETIARHCDRVLDHVESRFVPGTALVNYGDGDWDDTLQPADPSMRTRMVSAWTVALCAHVLGQFACVFRRAGDKMRAERAARLLERIGADFSRRLMPEGIVAGFLVTEADGRMRPLLHPADNVTGIRYRLLPMTRAILAGLFTPGEAARHVAIIHEQLRFPDGVRLMSEPAVYHGGLERLFKRADTAANVGREIGLQYVHAHLRYAEAMALIGDAAQLWWGLQVVNPVGLREILPHAAPRQANVYFSSSDADFSDRYEAARRWPELRSGGVEVRGGWRLYSSGPGLFLRIVRSCLLGVRESFGDVVFDPVLPQQLDGLTARLEIGGRAVEVEFRVGGAGHGPRSVAVNGTPVEAVREPNRYRTGGLRVAGSRLASLLGAAENRIKIQL